MLMRILIHTFYCLLCCGLIACTPAEEPPAENDILLARVYNKTLYLSDMAPLIPANSSVQDSTMRLHALVEQWIRDALLMHEAEKNIPKDLNIDKLVRDYRSSLILHNYEKVLIESMLDSIISREELVRYYEENKLQYKLESPILRCYLIQFPEGLPEEAEIKTAWDVLPSDSLAFNRVKDFSLNNATTILLTDSIWHRVEQVETFFPNGNAANLALLQGASYQLKEKGFNLWCKVLESKQAGETAPFSFVETQIRRLILHKRKLKLLSDTREDIYEQEMSRNNVQVFVE